MNCLQLEKWNNSESTENEIVSSWKLFSTLEVRRRIFILFSIQRTEFEWNQMTASRNSAHQMRWESTEMFIERFFDSLSVGKENNFHLLLSASNSEEHSINLKLISAISPGHSLTVRHHENLMSLWGHRLLIFSIFLHNNIYHLPLRLCGIIAQFSLPFPSTQYSLVHRSTRLLSCP